MKQQKKYINLIVSLAMVLLAVVSVMSVTSAYFTASANRSGELNFATLDVGFAYYTKVKNGDIVEASDSATSTGGGTNVLNLYVFNGAIVQRGIPFEISLARDATEAIHSLAIENFTNSCSAYFRFYINAYMIAEDVADETENYGEYFELDLQGYDNVLTGDANVSYPQDVMNKKPTYFYKNALSEGAVMKICSKLVLSTRTPAHLLGEKFKLTMTLEAVQSQNEAFKSAFADERGYCNKWK